MIHVYGIGPGNPELLLSNFELICQMVDVIIGSERQLEIVSELYRSKCSILPKKLSLLVEQLHTVLDANRSALVLASGDPMLYGIGSYLFKQFDRQLITLHSGISSLQYIFSRIGVPMNDCYVTSSHGREPNLERIASSEKVVMVTDEKWGPYQLAQALVARGVNAARMFVGENLSYEDETISEYDITQVPNRKYELNVVVILHER